MIIWEFCNFTRIRVDRTRIISYNKFRIYYLYLCLWVNILSTCSLFGSPYDQDIILPRLRHSLYKLISQNDVDLFYLAYNNSFDKFAIKVLTDMKKMYPHINWRIVLTKKEEKRLNTDKPLPFDAFVPTEIAECGFRAGRKRDNWMVDNSDYLIICLSHFYGRVPRAGELAFKRGKFTMHVSDYMRKVCEESNFLISN